MNVNDEFFKKGFEQAVVEIIKCAEEFECCPDCGNPDADSHFCDRCHERISVREDAGWFAQYLRKKYNMELKED